MARLKANLAAIKVVKALQAETRAATPAEQEILARWSGWGAVAAVFEGKPGESRALTQGRQQLRTLLTDKEYAAARRNTINAHYTGTALAQAMWDGLAAFGFSRRAGPGARMRGRERSSGWRRWERRWSASSWTRSPRMSPPRCTRTRRSATRDFADTQLPEGSFDAAVGNVPFGKIHMNDPRYNPGRRYPIHTHFLLKSAALVRPGGWIALITSRYTLDGTGEDAVEARRKLAGFGELAAAVRLPAAAHRRTAGTDVVTDVLVIRRFEDGEQPPPGEPAWIQTVPVDVGGVQIPVNRYFADHPGMVLGDLAAGGARRAEDLQVVAQAGADVATGLAQALAGEPPPHAPRVPRPAAAAAGHGPPDPRGTSKPARTARSPGSPAGSSSRSTRRAGRPGRRNCGHCWACGTRQWHCWMPSWPPARTPGRSMSLRADLNARYDAYVADYGPVNRHTRQVKIRDTREGRALRDQLLAEGEARFTGGKLEISDPAVRDRLVAAGHATVTETGELRFGRTPRPAPSGSGCSTPGRHARRAAP